MSNKHVISTDGKVDDSGEFANAAVGVEPGAAAAQLRAMLRQVEKAQSHQNAINAAIAAEESDSCDRYCFETHDINLARLPKDLRKDADGLITYARDVLERSIATGHITFEIRKKQQGIYQNLRDLYTAGGTNALNFFVHEFNKRSPGLVLSMREESELCEELNAGLESGGWDSVYSIAIISRETGEPVELNNLAFR
jgi:hypothetical protein